MTLNFHVRWFAAIVALALVGGCRPASPVAYQSSEQLKSLSPDLQKAAAERVAEHCGTFAAPRLLGHPEVTTAHLKRGQAIYQQRCSQCHGDDGDGNGPAAAMMYPRPRDYRKGVFKFTSTVYGVKPLRDDLVKTIRRGVRGTSMPSFELIPKEDLAAVVDYVLSLTHRGELEERLYYIADAEEALEPETVQSDGVDFILNRWKSARESTIMPLTLEPAFTAEHVQRGKQRFLAGSTGCMKCHGEDGRGRTPDNLAGNLKDAWGHTTRAADLTSGMLRGGQEPMDIYRRIYGGINGTPMPGFAGALKEEPEAIWDLVAYVKYISNRRRAGESAPPGEIRPYLPPHASDAPPSAAGDGPAG